MTDTVRGSSSDDQPTTLYRLYDAKGGLLYVGIATRWHSRMGQHAHDKPWFHEVKATKLEEYPNRAEALRAEAAAIQAERPVHNVKHNGRKPAKPQRPTSPNKVKRAFGCHYCGKPIADGTGYFRTSYQEEQTTHRLWTIYRAALKRYRDREIAWEDVPSEPDDLMFRAMHAACDTNGEWGYCIEIERIRTLDQFNDWMQHLRGKFWFQYVDLYADLDHFEVQA